MVIKDAVLPTPNLPQITMDNTISLNDLTVAGGVFVRIQEYSDAARGDYLYILWDNQRVKEVLIDDLATDFPVVVVITNNLSQGAHFVSYTVEDLSGNTSDSTGVNVNIIKGDPEIIYPAPIFSDAVNNIVDHASIIKNAGTHVHVAPYDGIMSTDTVILFWRGMNADGQIINGDSYTATILAGDVSSGITFLIPEDKLEVLKDEGRVTASYQVRRSGAVLGVSDFSEVALDLSGGDSSYLQMCISTGAVNTDYDSVHIYPYNQGVIKGIPGETVVLSVVGSAVFNETGADFYQPILNEFGEASFKLRSATQGSNQVSAEELSNPGVSITQIVRFGAYEQGTGNIKYLNYSTGAPANGLTPCSIYLKTAQESGLRAEITVVRVTIVSGSAKIDGYPDQSSADIILNADKSVVIDIVNSVAETTGVEISLPESSGSINKISLVFKRF